VLEWVVARAHFKWEEAKISSPPHPPLELSIFRDWHGYGIIFSFDRASGGNGRNSASTSRLLNWCVVLLYSNSCGSGLIKFVHAYASVDIDFRISGGTTSRD
jgi:hypothetical protein